ncbi:glycosyl hydrolase-related protein [candidate division KSB1 bacterium]|nr:glycosyl hydrolase-related protein [candidate division KSB1 bacterium]
MAKVEFAKIEEIRPTIFFKSSPRGLDQMLEIVFTNPRAETNASLVIKYLGQKTQRMIFGVKPGTGTYQVEMPDLNEPTEITFELSLEGKLQDQMKLNWQPARRWEIYLVQFSHHHLHYTNLPADTLRDYYRAFNRLIDLCEETAAWPTEAQFRYTIETTWPLLSYLRNMSRQKVDKLLQFIKEGRIEIAALFGNEITDLCSSEELIRLLYPVVRLKKLFNLPVKTAMLTNVSGVSWGLATALAEAGIRYFSPALSLYAGAAHPHWDEAVVTPQGIPTIFNWQTPAGKDVLFWQGDEKSATEFWPDTNALSAYLNQLQTQGYPYPYVRRLITSATRDNAPPTRAWCDAVMAWNKKWAYPKLVLGTNTQFFERLQPLIDPNLHTLRGSIPGIDFPVVTTSMPQDLALNRHTQRELAVTEKVATLASQFTTEPYPAEELRGCYEKLMLFDEHSWGQFHPLGVMHAAALLEKKYQAYSAAAQTYNILIKSLNRLADEITLADDFYHLVVFNPLTSSRTDLVSAELAPAPATGLPLKKEASKNTPTEDFPRPLEFTTLAGRQMVTLPLDFVNQGFEIVDLEDNSTVPYQINELADASDAAPDAAERYAFGQTNPLYLKTLLFVARNVPPLGLKVYQLKPATNIEVIPKRVEAAVKTFENRFYRIIIATNTGGIFSIFDKESGQELVDGFAHYRVNQLFVRMTTRDVIHKLENVNIRRETKGAISTSMIITGSTVGCPQCIQEITLYNDVKRIDFTNRILKDATPLQEVYLAFPFQVKNPQIRLESGLTVIDPIQDHFPGANPATQAVQNWISLSNSDIAIAWTSLDAPVIQLGGLWPGELTHFYQLIQPKSATPITPLTAQNLTGHIYSLAMTGNYRTGFSNRQVVDLILRYSMTSFKGDVNHGQARQFGWAKNYPLQPVFVKGPQSGKLPAQYSCCQIAPENVVLLALKQAEFGNQLILRLWETEGKASEVTIKLNLGKLEAAFRTNLVEEGPTSLPLAGENILKVPIEAGEVITLALTVQK